MGLACSSSADATFYIHKSNRQAELTYGMRSLEARNQPPQNKPYESFNLRSSSLPSYHIQAERRTSHGSPTTSECIRRCKTSEAVNMHRQQGLTTSLHMESFHSIGDGPAMDGLECSFRSPFRFTIMGRDERGRTSCALLSSRADRCL